MRIPLLIFGTLGAIGGGMPTINAVSTAINPMVVNTKSTTLNVDNFLDNSWRDEIKRMNDVLDMLDEGLDTSNNILEEATDWGGSLIDELKGISNEMILEDNIIETAVEGGILTGSLGTLATTVGVATAIAIVVYGSYYTYTHWDDIKFLANKTVNNAQHYVSSATNYLKNWWSF